MIYNLVLIENVERQSTLIVAIGRLQRVPDQLKRLLLLVLLRQARLTEEQFVGRVYATVARGELLDLILRALSVGQRILRRPVKH